MFAPPLMAAPPPMTYQAPTFAPRPPAVPSASRPSAIPASPQAAAPAVPKPVIRAQAPEEPNPARPPQLTLPSPEQLGVAIRPVAGTGVSTTGENATDWTALRNRMKELGIVSFHMDSLPDGRTRFTCWVPHGGSPGVTRRIECVAGTEAEAVQLGLRQAAQMRLERP